jgi:hypothetical protein
MKTNVSIKFIAKYPPILVSSVDNLFCHAEKLSLLNKLAGFKLLIKDAPTDWYLTSESPLLSILLFTILAK